MIWVNFDIFVHLKSLSAQLSRPSSQVPWVFGRAETYLLRNNGLSPHISWENGDHFYTKPHDTTIFSNYNLILEKLEEKFPEKRS